MARIKISKEDLTKHVEEIIKSARDMTALLMKEGFIPEAPEEE